MYNKALRLIREYHRLSQTELAAKLGLSKSYVSELERNKKPTIEVIERYAEAFSIPVSSLLLFAEQSNKAGVPEKVRVIAAGKVLKMLEWIRDTTLEDSDDYEEEAVERGKLTTAST
jgi:transcriptional regulator with XRE-family HTH domain